MPSSAGSWHSTGSKTDDGVFQTNTARALAEEKALDVFLAFRESQLVNSVKNKPSVHHGLCLVL